MQVCLHATCCQHRLGQERRLPSPATYATCCQASHRTGSNRRWPRTRIRQSERPQPRLVDPRDGPRKKGRGHMLISPGPALGYLDKPRTLFRPVYLTLSTTQQTTHVVYLLQRTSGMISSCSIPPSIRVGGPGVGGGKGDEREGSTRGFKGQVRGGLASPGIFEAAFATLRAAKHLAYDGRAAPGDFVDVN